MRPGKALCRQRRGRVGRDKAVRWAQRASRIAKTPCAGEECADVADIDQARG